MAHLPPVWPDSVLVVAVRPAVSLDDVCTYVCDVLLVKNVNTSKKMALFLYPKSDLNS